MGGLHPKDRNEVADSRSELQPGRAGLEASDAHLRPRRAGTDNAAALAATFDPSHDSDDDRVARGASIWARPSQTVSFDKGETNNPHRIEIFSQRTEVPLGASRNQQQPTGKNWPHLTA
ncbi:hypothetical protein SmB9_31740 [Sphingosinicella microcystinivorans]|uniref:Uncharacterized protein n=1 Tax=Sphingosinicella microcystinivorans TaxID=335406 RepID=A0AAD1G2D8_SPHMI|nr:hypothetical protein SmB9_31740 [Sphingosinicella microcystinivorans]